MTEEIVEKGLKLLETGAQLAINEGPKVLAEFLNYMVFLSVVDLLKVLVLASIPCLIVNIMSKSIAYKKATLKESYESVSKGSADIFERERYFRAQDSLESSTTIRTVLVALTIIATGYHSIETVTRIGKIVLAPRVFMIQEGAKLLRGGDKK